MIVPMKKVSLVLLESERKQALKQLRKLGVVHLEHLEGKSVELSEFRNNYSKIEAAYQLVSEIKLPKKIDSSIKYTKQTAIEESEKIISLYNEKKQATDEISKNTLELERVSAWGEINPEDFVYLSNKGINLSMFEIPADKYPAIPDDIETVLVNSSKSQCRFLCISTSEGVPQNMPPEAFAVTMPVKSSKTLSNEIIQRKARIKEIDDILFNAAKTKNELLECRDLIGKDVEFENVFSGMERENQNKETSLAWITGFIPESDLKQLQNTASAEKWAIVYDDPADSDEVPTKLENNKFVSLVYPVSDFLGTVPGYHEYDISNWFLVFFTIFFAMIFGDAGYGSLMVVVSVFSMLIATAKKQKINTTIKLLLLLGLATVAWGAVTCTWFGLRPDQLPSIIKNISFKPLSSVVSSQSAESELWVKQNMQIFCFILALVQLSIAHLKGILRYRKTAKCLGELGSLLMLWGLFYVVLDMVVDSTRFPFSGNNLFSIQLGFPLMYLVLGLIGVGFLLNFVFSNYAGNIGKSVLESCKNIVSVLLGVVNVFSDIVSYIRLWAVGLAGSAISATVNEMAGPTLGRALIFLGILLLVFGHGLNMILNVLSVIVHGVRLNTLEFSNHLGMSWSGFKYEPFSEYAE